MKLCELLESPFRATEPFKDYSEDQIHPMKAAFKLAKSVFKFENEKFELKEIRNGNRTTYGLVRSDDQMLLGWMMLSKNSHHEKSYLDFDMIYVLPQFRKPNVIILLLKGVRADTELPWWINGSVFAGGERVITTISKMKMFDVKTVNVKTGEERDFSSSDIDDVRAAIVVEDSGNYGTGWLFEYHLFPFSDVKTYTSVSSEYHNVDW